MDNEIAKIIESQIGYHFWNPFLLQQAFTRRSYTKEHGGENNEVLEFIGDKALDFIIVKLLSEKYGAYAEKLDGYDPYNDINEYVSEYNEGRLTEIKKKLVCREMLANRIRMLGFQYELITGSGDEKQEVWENDSVQEDLFEAIVGAVALDSNWNIKTLETVVDLMLEPNYYLENGFNDEKNYVALLQQWYQKEYHNIPVYVFNNKYGNYYGEYGNWTCLLGLSPFAHGFTATGSSKSEARMKVAKQAYEYLEENNLLFDLIDEVGEPEFDRAINQLQELYQKGYIGEPWYDFYESYDDDGNPIWHCECHVEGEECYFEENFTSKKYGKKSVAYDMLCYILEQESDDDET